MRCRDAELLEVVRAAHPGGRFADLLDGRQEQADQDGDDRDDHQQFDQRERRSRSPGRRDELRHEMAPRENDGWLAKANRIFTIFKCGCRVKSIPFGGMQ
jgi:hypothetical protein